MFKVFGTLAKLAVVAVAGFFYLAWMASEMDSDPDQNTDETTFESVPTRSGRIRQDCKVYPTPTDDAKPIGWLSRRTAVIVEDNGGEWLELLAPGGTRYLDRTDYLPWSEIKKYDKLYIKKSTFTIVTATGRGGRRASSQRQVPLAGSHSDTKRQRAPSPERKTTKRQPMPPAF